MISELAVEKLEDLEAEGLKPTPRDVVRLNAMGLKLEATRKLRPIDSTYYLPRVAAISDEVSFRQPTIGHEVWLDRISRVFVPEDYETVVAIKAFALSRPSSALPDPDDPKSVKKAIAAFSAEMKDFTRSQIIAALDYCIYGADPSRGEYAPAKDREPDGSELEDWKCCISVGVLHEARLALFGATQAEIEAMPRQQVEDLIRRSFFYHRINADASTVEEERNFYNTFDEIRSRLLKEKEAMNNG